MEFYTVRWDDHVGVNHEIVIPYSEIIGFEVHKYNSIQETVYKPITRTGGYDYRSLKGEEGLKHYEAWKKYKECQ